MRVIISTGQGRLHLFESAKALQKSGVHVTVITGWVPSTKIPRKFIDFLGLLVGHKNLYYGLIKRRDFQLNQANLCTCSLSEFFMQFLVILAKFKLINNQTVEKYGWKSFGLQSKKYIVNADIFHVRTAAGNSGAIAKAKKAGMIVLADQSAAHPFEIYSQLSKAYEGGVIPFNPNTGLWRFVLDDCRQADYILVNSEYVKKSFIQHGFEQDKINVIPLGIRQDFSDLKTNYKINGSIKLLYTGSFRRWKGSHIIIDAVRQLIDANVMFCIDIIGIISDRSSIPDWFANHPDVRLHGHLVQDQLKEFLANSDLYIFPSYCDGGAQSQKEAMAAGLPVITSEKSGSPITHGENGWIIPDNSSHALFDAILELANDEHLRERLGRKGAVTIRQAHTWAHYGKKVTELYSKIHTDAKSVIYE